MIQLLHGDCRAMLRTLPNDSVHCCVTSPPYWGLRSYLPPGHDDKHLEIGSEPTVDEWVQTMVEVFREVRRVLRPDGTLWLNLGDSYATGAGKVGAHPGGGSDGERARACAPSTPLNRMPMAGFKPKDLIGQPWRVAFALQADGWWLRQEIIWAKKNPMPESVTDRFTKAHEHVFLLSKSERYYFDLDAVKEEVEGGAHARRAGNRSHKGVAAYEAGDDHHRTKGGLMGYDARQRAKEAHRAPFGWAQGDGSHTAAEHQQSDMHPKAVGRRQGPPGNPAENEPPKADLATSGNDGAYADGKSARMGRVAGWRKLAEAGSGTKNNDSFDGAMAVMPATRNPRSVRWLASEPFKGAHFATYPPELIEPFILAGCPLGGTVLDPFGGSGTTGMVADRLGRKAILIDLDERNLPMAQGRIDADKWNAGKRTVPMFEESTQGDQPRFERGREGLEPTVCESAVGRGADGAPALTTLPRIASLGGGPTGTEQPAAAGLAGEQVAACAS
jgi:DNA modification methylase